MAATEIECLPPSRFPEISRTGIYSGRYKDRSPGIRPAGVLTTTVGDAVVCCMKPPLRPPTPEVIQKFQDTFQPKAGKKRIFYSKASDPHRKWAEEAVHGKLAVTSAPAGVLLNPTPKSLFQQRINDEKERHYQSHKRAPLARTHDQAPNMGAHIDQYKFTFGIKSESDGYAGDLINPNKTRPQIEEEHLACRDLYRQSHASYLPGEQRSRHYFVPSYEKEELFGKPTPNDPTGKQTKQTLHWITEKRGERGAPVISKRLDDFRERTQPQLGRVHDPIKDTLCVAPDHTFGIMYKPDEYGVGDLLHGRGRGNFMRGRERIRGVIAAMRQHLKKANYHNFESLLEAFKFYDISNCGKIGMEDLRRVCLQFGMPAELELLYQLMDYCDADRDGMISYEEFCNFLNWKDKMPSGYDGRPAFGAAHSAPLPGRRDDANVADPMTPGRLEKQIDQAITEQQTSASMINAVVGGPSTRCYRRYGCPSIRSDIPAPVVRSVSDRTNYGDESDAWGLIQPSIFSHKGVYERDMFQSRSKAELQEIFLNIGVQTSAEDFDNMYQIAASRHPEGEVCVESLRSVLDEILTQSVMKSPLA